MDAFVSTGQGFIGNNMLAYCLNNPVYYTDSTGTMSRLSQVSVFDADKPVGSTTYDLHKRVVDAYAASEIELYSTVWSALMDWRATYLPLSEEYEYAAYLYSVQTTLGTYYYFSETYCGSKGGYIMSANVIVPTIILEVSDGFSSDKLVAQVHSHPKTKVGYHNDFPSYSSSIYGGDKLAYNLFGYTEMYIIPYSRCADTPMVIAFTDQSTWCINNPY